MKIKCKIKMSLKLNGVVQLCVVDHEVERSKNKVQLQTSYQFH